ncbi:MAG: hypothetical protein AABN95_15950 [Acidobacteriota bacterium]
MTDTTVVALIGGITSITASLVAAYSSRQAANKASEAVKKTDENTKLTQATSDKVDVVDTKATEIHQLTNSHLSEITSQLKVALERISGLEQTADAIAKERSFSDKERAEGRTRADVENGADDPLPVVDHKVVETLDRIVTPKLDKIQGVVDDVKDKK